jgi:L-ascorbate metabolism protein UlaG (beta-lactamase superfamily)
MRLRARAKFTWLGHASVRVDLPSGEIWMIDPFLAGNPKCPAGAADLSRCDLILVTHAHGDHMGDVESLAKRHRSKVICAYDLGEWFAERGVADVSGMNLGGTQRISGARITQVRADHSSGFRHEGRSVYGGPASGYVVRLADGFTFYHAGDTALFSDMKLFGELYQPELAFLPIGDHFTMDPEQAAHAAKLLGCRWVVPIHWGTFGLLTGRPAELRDHLAKLGGAAEVVELAPGASFEPPA